MVLLGEASHGTSEFYTWRARISQRLINEKKFNIIAVEGDWADAYPLNNYIRGTSSYATASAALQEFDRWPTWMWANNEMADLAEWLKSYNSDKTDHEQVGFYGLDVYGLWESMELVYEYLVETDPAAAETAREVLACFAPFQDGSAYARATVRSSENCADELASLLKAVKSHLATEPPQNEQAFNVLQNTMVAVNGENYYRIAATNSSASWNIRDRHMARTIGRLLDQYEPNSKIIIWEHNTHVGDARATDMKDRGMVNVGQIVREQYGKENVYIVGFGTYSGKVIAARSWGSRMREMNLPKARRNSWEWILHRHEPPNKIILMHPLRQKHRFQQDIGHRAIGVVYNPSSESGNYVPSVLPERYDAFIFIDKNQGLHPF